MSAPKRPLFNRPAWAAKEVSSNKGPAVFGRHQVYDEVLELEEKRRIRREAEAEAKEKVKRESLGKENSAQNIQDEEPQQKKRRLSEEPAEEDSGSESDSVKSVESVPKTSEIKDQRVTRSTPKKDKTLKGGLSASPSKLKASDVLKQDAVVIELGDEDSVDENTASQPESGPGIAIRKDKTKPNTAPEPDSEDSDDDEYVKELKKKAREKARLQQRPSDQSKSAPFSPASDIRSPSTDQTHPDAAAAPSSAAHDAADPFNPTIDNAEDDPYVGILIKSLIPNSKPLIVNRRASQPLQHVKDFWCTRQNFEPSFSARVFFTWRDEKLFNSTTMRTVLRLVKKEGGFDPEGHEDPSKGKIVVEAMTEEIYQERKKAKERQKAAEAKSENQSEAEDEQEAPDPPLEQPKRDGIVIRLTSQGLEPMPLRVRPHTSIRKIMHAFQGQRGVAKEKTCWLVFDGDKLDQEISVEDAGFEEGDEIEVYPR